MKNLKIGIITQARIGSTRLPGKTLLKLNNETLLGMHLRRLKESGLTPYLATTTEDGVEELLAVANSLGVPFKIGSLDDVLSRYYLCAKENNLDVIIRVTSDCPLIAGELIRAGVEKYLNLPDRENVYLSNTLEKNYPRGMDFEIFSFKLLEHLHLNCLDMKLREHVTPELYLDKYPFVKKFSFVDEGFDKKRSDWRLCVDVQDDFKLISELVIKYQAHLKNYSELSKILDNNTNLIDINSHVEQKKLETK